MLLSVPQDSSNTSASNAPGGYEQHFGLVEAPFTLTSNPRFLYESSSHLAALREIAYGLPRREPVIVVTGAIGCGKTTLCRIIAERRGPRTFVATINTPPANVDDLLRLILDGFGILADDTSRIVQASHYGLLRTLQQFLASLVPLNAQAIILFDEAQHLSPEMLEQIRLLSNIDVDSRKLLQIILVGQPELEDVLAREDLRQLNQRVSRRHRLGPLEPGEIQPYVDRRLSVAQGEQVTGHAPEFTPSALQAIQALSGGVPRIINTMCDRALEEAWEHKTHTIDAATVLNAAAALGIAVPPLLRLRTERRLQAIAAAVLVVAVVLLWWAGSAMFRRGAPAANTTASAAPAKTAAAPAPVQPRPSPAATAPVASTTPPPVAAASDGYLILVSSFRTSDRSEAMMKQVNGLGLRSSARNAAGGWQQVVVGPFASRQEASAAQDKLEAARISGTRIVDSSAPSAASASDPVVPAAAPPASVTTTPPPPVTATPPAPVTAAPSPAAATPSPAPVRPPASAPATTTTTAARGATTARAPLPENAPIADLLQRASALSKDPDVRGIQQIRDLVAKRQAATPAAESAQLTSALEQVDKFLEDARKRQLENDARRFAEPGTPGNH